VIYTLASLLLIARQGALDPSHVCICVGPNGDPPFFMWALKWWPYAIGHGLNPFYTNVVWYPGGANIATTTSIPGVAVALWPVTSLFGPIVAYNLAALLSPVLGALAAYALCRYLTGRFAPALVGGFIYGFSSYELGQLTSHLQVALVCLVPLIALAVVRRHDGTSTRRRFIVELGGLLAVQVLVSTEIAFDVTLLGAIALIGAWLLAPPSGRRRLLALAGEIVAGGMLALVAVSPYLYWALIKGNAADYGRVAGTLFAARYSLDPLNLVVPTPINWLGGNALPRLNHFEGGNDAEAGGYLGIPLLVLFAVSAIFRRRLRSTRLLLLMFVATTLIALGPQINLGSDTIVLPWDLVENAPLFRAVLPTRFAVFLALIVAVGVALELGRSRRRPGLAWLVAVVGVAAVAPNPDTNFWHSRPPGVPLVVSAAKRYLPSSGSVLFVPVGQLGSSMYWQAAANFDFHFANGRVALVLPPEYDTEQASLWMSNAVGPPRRAELREFLVRHRVTAVVVAPALEHAWAPTLRRLGLHATEVGDQSVYYVCGAPPAGGACGR
jgi:hypothetical protein